MARKYDQAPQYDSRSPIWNHISNRDEFICPCGRRNSYFPLQMELDSGLCIMCHDDLARQNGTYREMFYSED